MSIQQSAQSDRICQKSLSGFSCTTIQSDRNCKLKEMLKWQKCQRGRQWILFLLFAFMDQSRLRLYS